LQALQAHPQIKACKKAKILQRSKERSIYAILTLHYSLTLTKDKKEREKLVSPVTGSIIFVHLSLRINFKSI